MAGQGGDVYDIRCPHCDHLLAKVAPAPGVMVSLQCRTCKRLVVYYVPPLRVLREIIARAEPAAGRA